MRVISGIYKGRQLVSAGEGTRPTLDRTKETLFNILQGQIARCVVLDLFAGCGQIAIECLSRGAQKVYLCDNDVNAQKAIKTNFQKIGVQPNLFSCSYTECLSRLKDASINLVFIDPPYQSGYYYKALSLICSNNVLAADGIVVCEHSADDDLPKQVEDLLVYDVRKIGSVKFSFYRRECK